MITKRTIYLQRLYSHVITLRGPMDEIDDMTEAALRAVDVSQMQLIKQDDNAVDKTVSNGWTLVRSSMIGDEIALYIDGEVDLVETREEANRMLAEYLRDLLERVANVLDDYTIEQYWHDQDNVRVEHVLHDGAMWMTVSGQPLIVD